MATPPPTPPIPEDDPGASGSPSSRHLHAPPAFAPAGVRPEDVRPARFSGRHYPADPIELRRVTQALLPRLLARAEGAASAGGPRALGLVLPHGPLAFTGALAAAAIDRGMP